MKNHAQTLRTMLGAKRNTSLNNEEIAALDAAIAALAQQAGAVDGWHLIPDTLRRNANRLYAERSLFAITDAVALMRQVADDIEKGIASSAPVGGGEGS